MSFLLIQAPATAQSLASALQPVANVAKDASANSRSAAFSQILQLADAGVANAGVANQEIVQKINELIPNAVSTASPSADFFVQIIEQFKQQDGELNIAKLPEGNIRNLFSENILINDAIGLIQPMQQQTDDPLTEDAGLDDIEIANEDINASPSDVMVAPFWQMQSLPPSDFVVIAFKPSDEIDIANDAIPNDSPLENNQLENNQFLFDDDQIIANSAGGETGANANNGDDKQKNLEIRELSGKFDVSELTPNQIEANQISDFAQKSELAANNIIEGVATGEIDNITKVGDELPLRTENVKNENIKAENQGLVKINLASLQQISAQIKRLHKNKTGEINLQLNPVELGKVEIKVSNDINNNISVQITADLRETYDLLRSDRISLERILQDNGVINGTNNDGLNFDENNLQFAHREGSNNQENNNKHPNNFNEEYENIQQKLIELPIEQMVSLNIVTGINIRV
jgi:hypothetical protein